MVGYQISEQTSDYDQRQLWREKELAETDHAQRTKLVKQVLLPYFHTIQRNSLKTIDAEKKPQLMKLLQQLR